MKILVVVFIMGLLMVGCDEPGTMPDSLVMDKESPRSSTIHWPSL